MADQDTYVLRPETTKKPRGFAALSKERVREISRAGGKAAHAAGTAHEFSVDEAREAGRKGGRAAHAKRPSEPTGNAE